MHSVGAARLVERVIELGNSVIADTVQFAEEHMDLAVA
ncbi:hypothetical protein PsAD2_03765 [Pseudovibrio axinellae]|uniref:Uncharacterized protein n=1 Tax=Pseudovibrio axinellae TaxID=989403 RepID=A0A165V929_9HYPH|nr:hypothetical protein PsAD2_03765 [Pseudovibrio axinellae]SER96596.1 hypothetical protein SAMN05421798_1902 [Pseudovibrio axinellae]SER96786.1 hypothetical protein SAMN05421798_1912 [Pseudovibrio axinellae]